MTDLKIIFLNVKGLNNVVKTHTHTQKNSFILKKGKKNKPKLLYYQKLI